MPVAGSGDAPDSIQGGAGNDRIFGGGGGDFIAGEDGDDRIFGGSGAGQDLRRLPCDRRNGDQRRGGTASPMTRRCSSSIADNKVRPGDIVRNLTEKSRR